MSRGRVTIVYIAGVGRSGSTILDRLLGTLPGVVSGNEVIGVWNNGFRQDLGCACGASFRNCSFWRAVVSSAFPDREPNADRIQELQWDVSRSRHFWHLLADPRPESSFGVLLAEYRAALGSLYRAMADVSGCDIIIDSSKLPGEALVLAGLPGVDVRVIHLVRDARAVAHSWRRKIHDPGLGREQDRHGPLHTAAYWSMRNILAEMLVRRLPYVRVRYEDLMRSPQTELRRLTSAVDVLAGREATLSAEHTVDLGPVHAMLGNPQRFQTGSVELRSDEEWRSAMPLPARAIVTAMTLPLLWRYGYLGAGTRTAASAPRPAVEG